MFTVTQNSLEKVLQRVGDLLDRLQPAVSRPEIPALPVFLCPAPAFILPQVSEHLSSPLRRRAYHHLLPTKNPEAPF